MLITQVNVPTSSIFLHFPLTLPFQQQKAKAHVQGRHTGRGKPSESPRKYLSDILKSDCHKSTLNVFHSFAICPTSLFQISQVKVNLLYAKGKTKCQAAFHANVLGKLAAKTGTGVQSEGKTRAHGRIPAHLWQLCSACLVFSREKDVQLWTWPPLYGEGGLWSGPCGKGKIHPDRVEAEGISGTRRQSRQAKPLLGIRILLKQRKDKPSGESAEVVSACSLGKGHHLPVPYHLITYFPPPTSPVGCVCVRVCKCARMFPEGSCWACNVCSKHLPNDSGPVNGVINSGTLDAQGEWTEEGMHMEQIPMQWRERHQAISWRALKRM